MSRLRTGDVVIVIAGNDRGRQGKILRKEGERVVVEGINVRKKHMRKRQENQQSQIVDIECPIHVSNVQLLVHEKAVKLKASMNAKGEKELVYGKDQALYRPIRKPAKS